MASLQHNQVVSHNNQRWVISTTVGQSSSKSAYLASNLTSNETVFIFYPSNNSSPTIDKFNADIKFLQNASKNVSDTALDTNVFKLIPIYASTPGTNGTDDTYEPVLICKYTPHTRFVYQFLYD